MIKKLLCVLLALCMMAGLAACSGETAPETTGAKPAGETTKSGESGSAQTEPAGQKTSTKDTLVIANTGSVDTWYPFQNTSEIRTRVDNNIRQSLWHYHYDGTMEPVLATEWNWVDETHFSVTLREGVKFSNGNDFTADDIVFTIEQARGGAFPQYYEKIDLEATEIPDDHHIIFAFTSPDPTFVVRFGNSGTGMILDKESIEADPDSINTTPVGTGPYMLESQIKGDSETLVPNPLYWGETPILQKIIFRAITDVTQRSIALQTGDVDFAYELSELDIDSLDTAIYNIETYDNDGVYTLFFNSDPGHNMADENIRKAVKYCIDKELLANVATNGFGHVAWTPIVSTQHGFNEKYQDYDPYPQDFEKAKATLAEAGYADGVKLKVIWADYLPYNNIAEALQNWFAQGGIDAEFIKGDFAATLSTALDRTQDWDIFILGNGQATPVMTLSWFDRAQGAPFAKFEDEEFYKIIDQIFATVDADVQMEKCIEAQDYIMQHVGVVPVGNDNIIHAYTNTLKGYDIWHKSVCELALEQLYFE